jgi:hypothetical protein
MFLGMGRGNRGHLRFTPSAPLSEPSSILTDASLTAGTEPERDVDDVVSLSRGLGGMWTFGDGAAGESATTLSLSSADMTEAVSFFGGLSRRDFDTGPPRGAGV